MPLLVIKLMENDSPADLKTAADAYLAGVPTDGVRGADGDQFLDHDQDTHAVLAMAHGGLATPGSKTADPQLLAVDSDQLAKAQTAVDDALANIVHSTVTDGVTTTPGKVTSATAPFEAEDVGRKIRIGTEERVITVHNGAGDVDYDNSAAAGGDFASGTGLTVELLGAESMQAGTLSLTCHKAKDRDTVFSLRAVVEGETL
jgi:hypothetical protein